MISAASLGFLCAIFAKWPPVSAVGFAIILVGAVFLKLSSPKMTPDKMSSKREDTDLPPNYPEIIKKALSQLEQIKKSNDGIPNKEISEDIFRIEYLTEQIINICRDNPENYSSLRKFFNYYLPTTNELLKTYEKLQNNKIRTSQIAQSMDEIAVSIKKIKESFVKIHDLVFTDTAYVISSDISAMMAAFELDGVGQSNIEIKKQK